MAPASVGIDSFPNRRPKLVGNLITTVGPQSGAIGGNGNLSLLQSGNTQVGGFSFTPTSTKNLEPLGIF